MHRGRHRDRRKTVRNDKSSAYFDKRDNSEPQNGDCTQGHSRDGLRTVQFEEDPAGDTADDIRCRGGARGADTEGLELVQAACKFPLLRSHPRHCQVARLRQDPETIQHPE